MVKGAKGPLEKPTHYISSVYYPTKGGYFSFATKLAARANVSYGKKLQHISFAKKEIQFTDGTSITYKKLINTIPLPILIKQSDAPEEIKIAADQLSCSSVLILNVAANHIAQRSNAWLYVYDESKLSSRINFTELLAPSNAPTGKCGIQVEVYFSKYHTMQDSVERIKERVIEELIEMKLLRSAADVESIEAKWIQWANVIFDLPRREALNTILDWLATQGLRRETDDLEATTSWEEKTIVPSSPEASLFLAGRFCSVELLLDR